MRNIKSIKLAIIPLLAAAFVGCGGGGGSDASFESETEITIVTCDTNTNSSWTSLSSGDVVSASKDAQLTFDHDSNGKKQVCVANDVGSAVVIKG